MTNYSKTTNFTAKDSLVSGDANKIVKGSEIDAEFDNIATASATKANIASPAFTGVVSFPDGTAGDPSITNTGDTNTGLFFSAADTLAFSAAGTAQFTMADGAIAPVTDNDVDLGTSSLEFKDGYFDGTLYTDAINLDGTAITSTAAEINILDGVTATAAELNILDGVTSTAAELNILDGVTATTAELNIMDGVTATTAELNIMDGVTSTAAELNILDGKAFLDEDDMSSNSATGIASQQSIKAYVDAQITAEDLDFQADSGGALSIDLDSETLTFTGGTGIDTSGSGNAVTFAIDSTVATLTGSQTLTNKTLSAPTLTGTATVASLDISGDIDVDGTTNLDVVDIDGAVDFASTTAHAGNATFADNAKAIFGAGSDLQIYHDGSNSYISDQGTNDLKVLATDFQLKNAADSEFMMTAVTDGAVTLYHNNAAKLATTSTGIAVTGSVTSQAIIATNASGTPSTFNGADNNNTLQVFAGTTSNQSFGLLVDAGTSSSDYAAEFRKADNTTIMRIRGDGNVGIGVSSPASSAGFEPKLAIHGSGSPGVILKDTDTAQENVVGTNGAGLFIDSAGHATATNNQINFRTASSNSSFTMGTAMTIDSSQNVGIGTSSITSGFKLEVTGDARFGDAVGDDAVELGWSSGGSQGFIQAYDRGASAFRDLSINNSVTVTSGGSVGIGTSSINRKLEIAGNNNGGAKANYIRITDTDTSATANNQQGGIEFYTNDVTPGISASIEVLYAGSGGGGEITFNTNSSSSGTLTEAFRVDENQNLLVGTTDTTPYNNSANSTADNGIVAGSGLFTAARYQGSVGLFNRTGNDGEILGFKRSGAAVGSIGSVEGAPYYAGTAKALRIGTAGFYPATNTGAYSNGTVDLGFDSGRFKDLHMSGSGYFDLYSASIGDGNIMVGEGVYVGAANGDNQIRSSSAGGGSATLYIGNAAIQVSSDQRLKTNIVDTELNALEKVSQVRVVDFNWDDPSDTSFNNRNARGKWTGVLAQELVNVLPFAVNAPRNESDLSIDTDSEQKWLVDQAQMVPVLIKAIQEQQTLIESLTDRIAALENN